CALPPGIGHGDTHLPPVPGPRGRSRARGRPPGRLPEPACRACCDATRAGWHFLSFAPKSGARYAPLFGRDPAAGASPPLPRSPHPMAMDTIRIRGARTHNLKNIDLDLPRDQLIVITGLSGSGKSSLAFDTIYAEGQRRYVESLSAYARQFLSVMEKP